LEKNSAVKPTKLLRNCIAQLSMSTSPPDEVLDLHSGAAPA